ncbi:MAG: hypothetical protein LUI87_17915 [Lachnospiraceae bacterium]|nr:hypothetical protein [Lachnospiraceae bacterium]
MKTLNSYHFYRSPRHRAPPQAAGISVSVSGEEEEVADWLGEAPEVAESDITEELAEKLNIPADTFVATAERYNEMCANGEDADYGKEAHRLTPVDTAPFYGVRPCAS